MRLCTCARHRLACGLAFSGGTLRYQAERPEKTMAGSTFGTLPPLINKETTWGDGPVTDGSEASAGAESMGDARGFRMRIDGVPRDRTVSPL